MTGTVTGLFIHK